MDLNLASRPGKKDMGWDENLEEPEFIRSIRGSQDHGLNIPDI